MNIFINNDSHYITYAEKHIKFLYGILVLNEDGTLTLNDNRCVRYDLCYQHFESFYNRITLVFILRRILHCTRNYKTPYPVIVVYFLLKYRANRVYNQHVMRMIRVNHLYKYSELFQLRPHKTTDTGF